MARMLFDVESITAVNIVFSRGLEQMESIEGVNSSFPLAYSQESCRMRGS